MRVNYVRPFPGVEYLNICALCTPNRLKVHTTRIKHVFAITVVLHFDDSFSKIFRRFLNFCTKRVSINCF